jgi:cytochrome c peroxidase
MPSHNHGMVLKPRITELSPSELRIDGVLLHMPGRWDLSLTIPDGFKTLSFVLPVDLTSLKVEVAKMVFTGLPSFTKRERQLAHLGRQLFFDPRFSKTGTVACATCHQPEQAFTDGKPLAVGTAKGIRNTPTLINVFSGTWFFLDGRADSLAAQALGPLEGLAEHGLSRFGVARRLLEFYPDELRTMLGKVAPLPSQGVDRAGPPPRIDAVPAKYAVMTLEPGARRDILDVARRAKRPAYHILLDSLVAYVSPVQEAGDPAVDRLFAAFGTAVAAYERGIVAMDSPFDRFAARLLGGAEPSAALDHDFGRQELAGLELFVGQGKCVLCHSGPNFTDQQFHNTGLPQVDPPYDLGRAAGIPLVRASAFNCLGKIIGDRSQRACGQIPYLDDQSLEAVGAFKTPTLRNVAQTAPYGHDGRFASLGEVLRHYNELRDWPSLGHREETLKPLHLGPADLATLEAFLRSLTSPVRELVN